MFKNSQIVAIGTSDRLVRVRYKKDNTIYQILGLAGTESVKKRDPDLEILRFNREKKLLGFRMALTSRVHYFVFPDNTFSMEEPDPEKPIASSVLKDAELSWGDRMK
jgi:hypothetical protein